MINDIAFRFFTVLETDSSRMASLDDIVALVRERLGDVAAAVIPFGSRIIFPGYAGGDVDLVVILAKYDQDVLPRVRIPEEMQRVRRALVQPELDSDDSPVIEIVKSLPKARIPLLKARHVPSQSPVDLVIHLGHPIVSSWFLRDIVAASSVSKKLIQLVRNWGASKDITRADLGMLPKYGYSLLVVAFLQKRGLLPANLFPITVKEASVSRAKRPRLSSTGLDPATYYTEGQLIRFVLSDEREHLPWKAVLDARPSISAHSDGANVDTLFQEFLADLEDKFSCDNPLPVDFRVHKADILEEFKVTCDDLFVLRDPITSRNVACILTPTTKVAILNEVKRARRVLSTGRTITDLLTLPPLTAP